MLKWEENLSNFTLSGIVIQGKESCIVVYKRYENNYIFSCPELGIRLKLVEAKSSDELKSIVLNIVKERLNSLISDIASNLDLINKESLTTPESVKSVVRDFVIPA